MSHHSISKEEKMKRFNRLIGQLEGIKQMVSEDRDCPEILIQISAVRAALAKFGILITEDHLEHCVSGSLQQKGKSKDSIESLMGALKQMLK
jgi:DNA-binding FrmR family transcriptional regulator